MQRTVPLALNSMLAALERYFPLTGLRTDNLHREMSLKVDEFFLIGGIQGMLEGKSYCAVGMVFPIACGFNCRLIRYTKSSTMNNVYVMHCSLMSRVTRSSWGWLWTSQELKKFGTKVRESNRPVVELFSFACTSGVNEIKFELLDHLVPKVRRFRDISVLDAFLMNNFMLTSITHIEGHPGG